MTLGLAAAAASAGEFLEQNGAALGGYDPFTYLGSTPYPTSGSRELSYTYKDSKFYFLTPGHLRAFAENPEQYAPQFGGYDAYGVSQGLKTPAHPRVFAVVDGKLYLFSDTESRKSWKKDVKGNILRASEQWPRIAQLAMR
jgi:YHS domain-containing protein